MNNEKKSQFNQISILESKIRTNLDFSKEIDVKYDEEENCWRREDGKQKRQEQIIAVGAVLTDVLLDFRFGWQFHMCSHTHTHTHMLAFASIN